MWVQRKRNFLIFIGDFKRQTRNLLLCDKILRTFHFPEHSCVAAKTNKNKRIKNTETARWWQRYVVCLIHPSHVTKPIYVAWRCRFESCIVIVGNLFTSVMKWRGKKINGGNRKQVQRQWMWMFLTSLASYKWFDRNLLMCVWLCSQITWQ